MNTTSRDRSQGTIVKRVAKKGHDEAHNSSWKIAFADFMLALMCLFLVLWVLAARSAEKSEELIRTTGGRLFDEGSGPRIQSISTANGSLIPREPVPSQGDLLQTRKAFANAENGSPDLTLGSTPARRRYESPADLQELASVITRLAKEAGLANNLQIMVTPYGLRIMLHDTDKQGMFERGSAFPNERFRRLLRKLGPVFATIENQLLIVGHTDSVPYAEGEMATFSNWTLSSNRAMAARYHLLAGGMPTSSTLQVVGMADRAPIDAKQPNADVNRRIELLILTIDQAKNIAAMFGVPGSNTAALLPGVDMTFAERDQLTALRNSMALKK